MPKQTSRRIIDSQNSAIIRQLQARVNVAGDYVLVADYEDADVLAKLLTVDGAGSELDADLLDGLHALQLPTPGVLDGDIIRWNAATQQWESCSEPFEFAQIVLEPRVSALLDREGSLWYRSTDKTVLVCTNDI